MARAQNANTSSCSNPAPHKSDAWSSGQDFTNVALVTDTTLVSQCRSWCCSCTSSGHEHHFKSCPATPSVPQNSCPRGGAAKPVLLPGRKLCHHPCGDNAVTHPKTQLQEWEAGLIMETTALPRDDVWRERAQVSQAAWGRWKLQAPQAGQKGASSRCTLGV